MEINVEQGYIILRHELGFSPIGWAIRKLTESFWNHVGGIVVDDDNSVYVIEAQMTGVAKTPIAEFIDPKKYIIKIVALNPDAFAPGEYERAIGKSTIFLRAKVGAKYDKRAIIWLAISYTFLAIFKKPDENPLQGRREFFCSELICQAWHGTSSIVEHLFAGKNWPKAECSTITPKDIGKTVNVRFIAGKDVR